MAVVTLTTSNFRQEVLQSEFPVIVDFYADWCGPCKQIAPAMEALSEKWDGMVRFAKVDIDAHPEIARGYNISSIPAVLRFENGEVTNWCLGAKAAHVMESELRLTRRGVGGRDDSSGGLLRRLFGRQ
ncbi:MAG: thioredoxin [Actinomycetota bacterium]|nr:thioredoxin [Actinomycetota bacterium]